MNNNEDLPTHGDMIPQTLAKIGERYKSVEFGYVVKVVKHYEDGNVVEIVESDEPDRIGSILHTAKGWPGGWAASWQYVPSKSENFNNLYEKLCGE